MAVTVPALWYVEGNYINAAFRWVYPPPHPHRLYICSILLIFFRILLLLLTYNSGDKPTWSADCSGSGYVVVVVDLQQRWQTYLISRLFWFRLCCCCCWLTTAVTSLPDQQTVLVQMVPHCYTLTPSPDAARSEVWTCQQPTTIIIIIYQHSQERRPQSQ